MMIPIEDNHLRYLREKKWHRYFLLWPERISPTEVLWLCRCERRISDDPHTLYEYRRIE